MFLHSSLKRSYVRIPFVLTLLFLMSSSKAQWAGSSSPAGSTKVVTQNNTRQNIAGSGKMKTYMGIGIGGYTSALTRAASYTYAPGYSSFNYIVSTDEQSTKGAGFVLGFLGKTNTDKLSVGVELGGGYHKKNVDYVYYDYWDNTTYSKSGYIESVHLGLGVPIRYSFVNNPDLEVYVQGVLGYGLIDVTDDDYNSLIGDAQGIFYGGGSIGARVSVLFAEIGYNSSGFLRLGLSF